MRNWLRRIKNNNLLNSTLFHISFFVLIIFAFIGIAWCVKQFYEDIYIPEIGQFKKANFEKWDKSLTIAVSISGFISIILTLSIWRSSDQRQIGLSAINLFDKFRDERISLIRNKVWFVRAKWNTNIEYRKNLIEFAFSKMNEKEIIKENQIENLADDLHNLYDLFEIFNILSLHTENTEIIKKCRYFYYLWWRKFLYEVAIELDHYEENSINLEFKSYENEFKNYIENISYVGTLKRLDKALGFSKIPCDIEVHNYD
jgi:hypothetical protein